MSRSWIGVLSVDQLVDQMMETPSVGRDQDSRHRSIWSVDDVWNMNIPWTTIPEQPYCLFYSVGSYPVMLIVSETSRNGNFCKVILTLDERNLNETVMRDPFQLKKISKQTLIPLLCSNILSFTKLLVGTCVWKHVDTQIKTSYLSIFTFITQFKQ